MSGACSTVADHVPLFAAAFGLIGVFFGAFGLAMWQAERREKETWQDIADVRELQLVDFDPEALTRRVQA